jgi:hypothetical protein
MSLAGIIAINAAAAAVVNAAMNLARLDELVAIAILEWRFRHLVNNHFRSRRR